MQPTLPLLLCALAAAPEAPVPAPGGDGVEALVRDALDGRPELAGARAAERAAKERVPQAGALPNPMLQLGLQNDGFDAIRVGEMESSYVLVMATQTFPFPGKLSLKSELASDDVRLRELATERLRRTTIAEVRRTFLAAQLAQARLELVDRLAALLETASALARSRYETGGGSQAELLRARLEQGRLRQRRLRLVADRRLRVAALGRLAGRPAGWSPTLPPLDTQNFPAPPEPGDAVDRALAGTPELLAAKVDELRADHGRALADRAALPDLAVGAGVMLRGALPPMWSLTIGVPLPIFSGSREDRGVAEAEGLLDGAKAGRSTLEQLVALRARQRVELWLALQEQWSAFADGLLADAASTTEVTLAQYRVGGASLAAVLDSNAAALALLDESLGVLAEARALAIAEEELSLAEPTAGAAGMGGSVTTGGGASSSAANAPGSRSDTAGAAEPASTMGM